MSQLSNKNYNISYTDIFCSFGPIPKNINLLDKEEIIQYNGIRIPRIPLGINNSLNLNQLLYNTQQDINLFQLKSYDNNKLKENKSISRNIEYEINELNSKETEIFNKENNNKINNSKKNNIEYLSNKTKLIHQISLNNEVSEEEKKYNLVPPNKFLILLDDIIKRNKKIFNLEEKYNETNKIILNNINDIKSNYYNIINKYFSTVFEKINSNNYIKNEQYYYSQSFSNLYNFDADSISYSCSLNQNENKPNTKILFKINYISNRNNLNENKNTILIKRGRKQTNINKDNIRVHSALDDDNVLRKIQVHFLSFTTNYINDIIKVFIIGRNIPSFKKIDYSIKKTVKHRYVEYLKSKTIGEIVQLRPSPKMKIHDDSVNKNVFKKVCSLCPFMEVYFKRNIISLFKEYYFNKNKIFLLNGKVIPLSSNTKTFNDLINKNYAYKEKFKSIAINYFLTKNRSKNKKPNFIINKNKFG